MLQQLYQRDVLVAIAHVPIEAKRPLISGTCCQRQNPIALFTRPLLAGLGQGFANPAFLRLYTGRQFPDVGLALAGKVGAMRDSCETKLFFPLGFCYEDHRLFSMLFDALRNPALNCRNHLLWIAPGWYTNDQARGQVEDEFSVGVNIWTHANHRTPLVAGFTMEPRFFYHIVSSLILPLRK